MPAATCAEAAGRVVGAQSVTLRAVRTEEQIQAQLDARLAELEAEAALPARRFPCTECTHFRWKWDALKEGALCENPLVVGYGGKAFSAMDGGRPDDWCYKYLDRAALCGPEKALWQPRISTKRGIGHLWQRLTNWLAVRLMA